MSTPLVEWPLKDRQQVTSQGERVPRGMGIQYSRTNILGDMSKYINNSDNFM